MRHFRCASGMYYTKSFTRTIYYVISASQRHYLNKAIDYHCQHKNKSSRKTTLALRHFNVKHKFESICKEILQIQNNKTTICKIIHFFLNNTVRYSIGLENHVILLILELTILDYVHSHFHSTDSQL